MRLGETLVFYCVVGLAVALAVFLRHDTGRRREEVFRLATAIVFWPLYLPILLARLPVQSDRREHVAEPPDEMARAIAQVDAELDAALSSLDGWAEHVLAREKDRIAELRAAWLAQAVRIRDMDRLLAQLDQAGSRSSAAVPAPDVLTNRRHCLSEEARQRNMERLHRVRNRAYQDLTGTLAWVRELVSMIHLAKFTGAPASRAEELVAQIAAAVEGVSAVTCDESIPQ